jgi:hypothetical protein
MSSLQLLAIVGVLAAIACIIIVKTDPLLKRIFSKGGE